MDNGRGLKEQHGYLADEQEKTIQYLEKVMKSDMIIYKFKESRVI
jgi:hypothetical protein